jgi:hypothetical protein
VAPLVQAPAGLPSAGEEGTSPLDEYWQQLVLLLGGAMAALGLAIMLTSTGRKPH